MQPKMDKTFFFITIRINLQYFIRKIKGSIRRNAAQAKRKCGDSLFSRKKVVVRPDQR